MELAGGVPPISATVASTTDSSVILVNNTEPGCDGDLCVKYTAGRTIASDIVTVSDSQTANLGANIVDITMQVEAATFTFDDGGDPATSWSTSSLNDLGNFTNDGDQSFTIKVNNTSIYSTGVLSAASNIVLSSATPDMWHLNPTGCDAIEVLGGGTCDVSLSFGALNGLSGPGTYTATLTVTGQNSSAEETLQFQATLYPNLEIQDPDNSYQIINDSNVNLGNFSGVDDETKSFRIRNTSSYSSGTLTFTFDEGLNPDMWALVNDGCTGTVLASNQYCEVQIMYRAKNGPGSEGNGPHESDIIVISPTLGTSSIPSIKASRGN